MAHHDHNHHHHHHEDRSEMSTEEKMVKLLEHWVNHNDDHASTYRDWAARAKTVDLSEVASLLEEAAEMTGRISEKFKKAASLIR